MIHDNVLMALSPDSASRKPKQSSSPNFPDQPKQRHQQASTLSNQSVSTPGINPSTLSPTSNSLALKGTVASLPRAVHSYHPTNGSPTTDPNTPSRRSARPSPNAVLLLSLLHCDLISLAAFYPALLEAMVWAEQVPDTSLIRLEPKRK